jgi:hypothetical protein
VFGVLPSPIENLPFPIVIDRGMLPAVSWLVQPVRDSQLERRLWTIECSHQRINGGWDPIARFREILHGCDWLASEFKLLTIGILL